MDEKTVPRQVRTGGQARSSPPLKAYDTYPVAPVRRSKTLRHPRFR